MRGFRRRQSTHLSAVTKKPRLQQSFGTASRSQEAKNVLPPELGRELVNGDQSLGTDDGGPQPRPIEEDSTQQAKYPDTDVSLGIAGRHRQARIDCPGAKGRQEHEGDRLRERINPLDPTCAFTAHLLHRQRLQVSQAPRQNRADMLRHAAMSTSCECPGKVRIVLRLRSPYGFADIRVRPASSRVRRA